MNKKIEKINLNVVEIDTFVDPQLEENAQNNLTSRFLHLTSDHRVITLIALVITIIVMLILLGVTLSITIGENGILSQTIGAKKETEKGEIIEDLQLKIYNKQLENNGEITDNELENILNEAGTLSVEGETILEKTLTTNKGKYKIKVSDIWNGTISQNKGPTFTSVANAPDISGFNKNNTYYVAYDLTSSPYSINESIPISKIPPNDWYDYTEGVNHWANIKTTGGGNDCYWVWIPRYAYQVPDRDSGGETINIKFLSETTNNPIDKSNITISNTTTEGSWNVSQAFWWDKNNDEQRTADEELSGIWVAKFEASSNNVTETTVTEDLTTNGGGNTTNLCIRIKPNVVSWRAITVSKIFTVCRNLTQTGNSLEKTVNIDSHMIKNSEWGTIAYLSRSKYGKNSAVWNNPYYNESSNSSVTGLCGASQDSSQTDFANTYEYNTLGGINASTTGNVYGIYDMAGGAHECVAGYLEEVLKGNDKFRDYSQSLFDGDSKYKDKYAGIGTDTENYLLNTDKYGDAIYETSTNGSGRLSWDQDYSFFATSAGPVFVRGGTSSIGTGAGVFSFTRNPGNGTSSLGFRPSLVITN